MWALLVKLLVEDVELALLRRQIGSGRTRRLGLQGQATVEKRGG
jgi:hypothetical protein